MRWARSSSPTRAPGRSSRANTKRLSMAPFCSAKDRDQGGSEANAGCRRQNRMFPLKLVGRDSRLRIRSSTMSYKSINLAQKFRLFDEQWRPKVVAEMNDYQFKVVKLQGDFIWHDHQDTDETFIVIDGVLRIDFRDGAVQISAGEMFVVPRGV